MLVLEWIGIGVVILLAFVAVLFIRRALMAGAGTIKLNLRVSTMLDGRGWSPGFGRFMGDELRFYRMFSLAIRPKRRLDRNGLVVERRRKPEGQELMSMPADWVILRCRSHQAPVEIAMAKSTVTGFLSWLEAAPPGAVSSFLATH
ncbi:DUF2550 domain-containing protein [Phytohabitans sp. ZYX-F-186]|uniref:DUF2550 domain-containing protein n=1 Tax=Phytohabitans maris TaxID=3071409 RepID=A0ABU0ZGZ7_9ACTN|nr:DUF2550 domain-containing protein [Phytohabitans sp. ZYX-F-186]MDQ7905612.1 DUF2550 domain-containing protein [Phytohabitans sp. ZYX-F-186]